MKKYIVVVIFLIGFSTFSNAQEYNTGIGFRGGFYNGLTIKHFLGNATAVEGIVSSRWNGLRVTALFEIHNQISSVEGLRWYYGFGGHVGFWNGANVSWANDNNNYTVIGVDGILGIEYNFSIIPVNISLDWKPAFDIVGHSGFWGDGGAFSIRYIF